MALTCPVNSHPDTNKSEDLREEAEEEQAHKTPFIMVFLFGGLALGLIIQSILKHHVIKKYVAIPYTVMLLIFGAIIGAVIQLSAGVELGREIFERFTMAETNPHVIMSIFLPILIFDSSFRMEAHSVFKCIGQILLMATVGLMITSTIIAGFMYAMLNIGDGLKEWNFYLCFVFGSILSATDPVAVVSLLREMGAPKELTILTEGESLFNDGTAIIVFNVFIEFSIHALGVHVSQTELRNLVLLQSLGIVAAPLVGLTAGKLCEIILKRTFHDEITEKGVIMIFAYGTFFICELLNISGVLALCILGIWLNYRKHSISPEVVESNNQFWDFFQHWANTLTFLLAGLVIVRPVIASATAQTANVYWQTILVYLVINLARFISIAILYPLLTRLGYGMNWKYAVMLGWGGLRGAIGLLLSMELYKHVVIRHCYDAAIGERVAVFVSGSVALTLLINATTFQYVLRLLDMDVIPYHEYKVMANISNLLRRIREYGLKELKDDGFYNEANWKKVDKLTEVTNPYDGFRHQKETVGHIFALSSDVNTAYEESRLRLLQLEKVSYWKQFEKGLLSIGAIQQLNDAVEHAVERHGVHLDFMKIQKHWQLNRFQRWLQNVITTIDRYTKKQRTLLERSTPSSYWRQFAFYVIHQREVEASVYLLVILDAVLFILDISGVFSVNSFSHLKIVLIALNSILLFCILVKLVVMQKVFFRIISNIFEFMFGFAYIGCIVSLAADLRTDLPGVYYAVEAIAALRIFALEFLLDLLLPPIVTIMKRSIEAATFFAIEATMGFIRAEQESSKCIFATVDNRNIAQELMQKCKRRALEATKALVHLEQSEQEAAVTVKTKQAAHSVLNVLNAAISEMKEMGLVDHKQHELLVEHLKSQILRVRRMQLILRGDLDFTHLLLHVNWTRGDPKLIDAIVLHAEKHSYKAGEVIIKKGDQSDGFYIIGTGTTCVFITSTSDSMKGIVSHYINPGEYFGEMGMLFNEPRMAAVISETDTSIYFLKTTKAVEIMKNFPHLHDQFIVTYCYNKAFQVLQFHEDFKVWSDNELKQYIADHCEIIFLSETRKVFTLLNPNDYAILVKGCIYDESTHDKYTAETKGCILLPPDVDQMCLDESIQTSHGYCIIVNVSQPPTSKKVKYRGTDPANIRNSIILLVNEIEKQGVQEGNELLEALRKTSACMTAANPLAVAMAPVLGHANEENGVSIRSMSQSSTTVDLATSL